MTIRRTPHSAAELAGRLPLAGVGRSAGAAVMLVFIATSMAVVAQEPYRFYGGDVDRDGKTPAMEACEYEELVEKQRCNRALNKTGCIDAVRSECREQAENSESEQDSEARPVRRVYPGR